MVTVVTLAGRTFRGDGAPDPDGVRRVLAGLAGWGGQAEVRAESAARTFGHGDLSGDARRGGLAPVLDVVVGCPTTAQAASEELALRALLADGTYAELAVDDPDIGPLTASVRLGAAPTITRPRGGCVVVAQLPLYSPDPLRYGPAVSATASFPRRVGGLVWPLFPSGVMDWGPVSASDRATVHNPGTAPAPVQVEVTGPVDAAGFEVLDVATGRGLTFVSGVAAGSRVLLDGATGNALVDGLYDRGDVLTTRFWPTVPPGGSLTLALRRRGSDIGGAPSMTVTVRPAYW